MTDRQSPGEEERPADEYGPWTRGNMGRVGRTVTIWVHSPLGWTPVVDWENHPDEGRGNPDGWGIQKCRHRNPAR